MHDKLNATKISPEKYRESMETISTQAEQQFVSTAQMLRKEGIEKGIRKTALKMIDKGYSNSEIIELTTLSEKEVNILREL